MKESDKISRRCFLKSVGTGAAVLSSALCAKGSAAPLRAAGLSMLNDSDNLSAMDHRTVPSTGTSVSLLGYGGMRWPTVGNSGRLGEIDQAKVETLIEYAMKHGVNYYDTAPIYHGGKSEGAMGKALKKYPRDSFFIATKLSNMRPNSWNLEAAKEMYQNSLQQLQVDYIDFYLLHSLGAGKDAFNKRFVDNGIMDFLKAERKEGRIRQLGFSFHGNKESFQTALAYDFKWDFVQIQLNYFDWSADSDNHPSAEYLYNELKKRNIPAVIMEPLRGGKLAQLNDKLLAQFKKRDAEQSPAQWAMRFVASLPGVLTALSGMTYMEHLEENVRTFSPLKPLTGEDKEFLLNTAVSMMKHPSVPCTACRYCMPCPFGIDIPANFAYFNKCLENGDVPSSKQSDNYSKARKRFLGNFSASVPQKAQSVHCTSCKHCVPLCPQHIDIPSQMKRINSLVETLKENKL